MSVSTRDAPSKDVTTGNSNSQAATLGLVMMFILLPLLYVGVHFGLIFQPKDDTNIVIDIGDDTSQPADTKQKSVSTPTPTPEPVVYVERDTTNPGWWTCDAQTSSTTHVDCDN